MGLHGIRRKEKHPRRVGNTLPVDSKRCTEIRNGFGCGDEGDSRTLKGDDKKHPAIRKKGGAIIGERQNSLDNTSCEISRLFPKI